MILLFTDFGYEGPYVGQVKAVLQALSPDRPVIDLMHDAPRFRPLEAGLLLARLVDHAPPACGLLCVVDPGVGGDRRPLILEADGRVFAGPDNGLLAAVAKEAKQVRCFEIAWRPDSLSASFHGRDLFAPALARRLAGAALELREVSQESLVGWDSSDSARRVVYIDGFGNAMTGIRGIDLRRDESLEVAGHTLARARTFDEVQVGEAFWYVNSLGLIEIAVNQGSAAGRLGLEIGSEVTLS